MAKDSAKDAYEFYDFDHDITYTDSNTIEGVFWSNEFTDEEGYGCYIEVSGDIEPGLADDEEVIEDFKLDLRYHFFDENDDEITSKSFRACCGDMTQEALDSILQTIEDILCWHAEKDDNLTLYHTQRDLRRFDDDERESSRRKGEW